MFDFGRFLYDKFRRPQVVISLLSAYNAPVMPKEAAVSKWFQRKTVPADWFPVLLAYIELDEGKPVKVAGYLIGG